MAKPFTFRYVNEIVGTFVLLTALALVVAVVLAGHAQEWFTPVRKIHIDFPVEGSLGIQKGAPVQILGYNVGKVERVSVEDDARMTGLISVKGDFVKFVRIDSQAVVKRTLGIAGDAYIEITEGQGDPLPEDFNLECVRDSELLELAKEMLEEVKKAVVPALEQLQKAVTEYTALAADLRNTNGPLIGLLIQLEDIATDLQSGKGTAGHILKDPALAREMETLLQQVQSSLAEVQSVLADVKKTTAQLPAMAETVGGEVRKTPELMDQTHETLREAERLIEGIQRHWLLRKNIPVEGAPDSIPPAEVIRP